MKFFVRDASLYHLGDEFGNTEEPDINLNTMEELRALIVGSGGGPVTISFAERTFDGELAHPVIIVNHPKT